MRQSPLEGAEVKKINAKLINFMTYESNEKEKQMKYFVEYQPTKNESKMWEELTEDEFTSACCAQNDFEPDIYFIQLTGPSLVIRSKS
tara:strand:+ start:20601 stop:20864 length:264 start_codon:yes stop_codon:yes gene_type:complete